MESPKCNKCNVIMFQLSDQKPAPRGGNFVVPNGKFQCFKCGEEIDTNERTTPEQTTAGQGPRVPRPRSTTA